MDQDGKVQLPHPHAAGVGSSGSFTPVLVGSGVLTNGYTYLTDTSIGWHSMVLTTVVSGSTSTSGIAYTVDAPNQTVHFSGAFTGDDRAFSYVIFNPGTGSPKVS